MLNTDNNFPSFPIPVLRHELYQSEQQITTTAIKKYENHFFGSHFLDLIPNEAEDYRQ
jgi:hypothetical protein